MVSIHCFLNELRQTCNVASYRTVVISGIRLHPTGVFSNLLMQKKRHGSRKHTSCQKVIVQYTKDADKDILFTMKVNEMKVCMDVYGLIWHLVPRFESGTVRKTEVMADRTI